MTIPLGNFIFSKLLQLLNALSPIVVTLSGIIISVKLIQESNALSPIVVTPLGNVILVIFVKLANIKCTTTGNGFVYWQSIEPNTILSDEKLEIKLKERINKLEVKENE